MASLNEIRILVTRPVHQARKLCQLIEQQGGTAVPFPVITIAGTSNPESLSEVTSRLKNFDMAIFISANAVDYGLKAVDAAGGFPSTIKLAAVGRSTAAQLSRSGHPADIFPTGTFNSEALLAMAELQAVAGKQIVIFRGEGGRELLASTLQQRGATVEYAECYRRVKPRVTTNELKEIWSKEHSPDIVTVTSNEGLQNLYEIAGEQNRERLLESPLVVVSERAVQLARQLGFRSEVVVAQAASDDAILDAVQQWHASN